MSSSSKRDPRVHTIAFVLLATALAIGWYAIWVSIAGEHPRYDPPRWWNFGGAYVLKSYVVMTAVWALMFSYWVDPGNQTWHKYAELIARILIALCVGAFFGSIGLTDAKMWVYFIGVVALGIGSGIAHYLFRTGLLWNGMFSLAAGYAFGFWSFVITLVVGYAIMLLTDSTLDEANNRDTVVD